MSFTRPLTDGSDLEGPPNHHPLQMKDLHLLQAWPSWVEAEEGVGLGAGLALAPVFWLCHSLAKSLSSLTLVHLEGGVRLGLKIKLANTCNVLSSCRDKTGQLTGAISITIIGANRVCLPPQPAPLPRAPHSHKARGLGTEGERSRDPRGRVTARGSLGCQTAACSLR